MRVLKFHRSPPSLEVERAEVRPLLSRSDCIRCKLHEKARSVGVGHEFSPAGDKPPLLMVVGEGPGKYEDELNRPFVGPTGRYFRPLIESLWSGRVVYTNATRCMLGKQKMQSSYIEACRCYLRKEIVGLSPDRIVCVGGTASSAILGRALPVLSSRKSYAHLSDGTPVLFLIHPAATFSNRFIRQWFENDLAWACSDQVPEEVPTDGEAYLIETLADAEVAVEDMQDSFGRVDFDTETFGAFGDTDFRVLTVACSTGRDAWVWDEAVLGGLRDASECDPLAALLADTTVNKGACNSKFDANAVWFGLGSNVGGRLDCARILRKMLQADSVGFLDIMQYLVGRGGRKEGGKSSAAQAAGVITKVAFPPKRKTAQPKLAMSDGDFEQAVQRVRHGRDVLKYGYAAMPVDVRARYCGMDAESAGAIIDWGVKKQANMPGLSILYEDVCLRMQRAVVMMERNGVLIDKGALGHARLHFSDRLDDMRQEMQSYGGFVPTSPKDVARILYDDLRLRCRKRTPSGQRSVDRDTLTALKHPLAEAILEYRTADSWRTRYVNGMDAFIRDDGRIHPSILMDGTATGRPSCSDPNMFNLPRPKTFEGKLIRNMVVAPPGWVLLEVDQSQVELRVAAELSGDEVMIDLFIGGEDFHLATALLIAPYLGVNPAEVTKDHPLRDNAKIVNFSVLYGDPVGGLAYKLGTTIDDAKKIQAALFGQFRKLKKWIDQRLREARACGWTRTYWKGEPSRYRQLLKIAEPRDVTGCATAERGSWNTPVQGSAADITNSTMGLVQEWLDEVDPHGSFAKQVLTVYDSVLLEVREDSVPMVAKKVVEISESHRFGKVPLVAEAKVGYAWGTMEDYDV